MVAAESQRSFEELGKDLCLADWASTWGGCRTSDGVVKPGEGPEDFEEVRG